MIFWRLFVISILVMVSKVITNYTFTDTDWLKVLTFGAYLALLFSLLVITFVEY